VNPPYLLAQGRGAIGAMSPRTRPHLPQLRLQDAAVSAMHDFACEPPLTLTEDHSLEAALDDMFRLGVRALLVVREQTVVGLITAEDARAARLPPPLRTHRRDLRVAEVMTASLDVPAIDWQTLQESRVSDLVEIFDATKLSHLIVLQSETATLSSVRGMIHRDRMQRQLGLCGWSAADLD
jgi:CBS domain-containing protein